MTISYDDYKNGNPTQEQDEAASEVTEALTNFAEAIGLPDVDKFVNEATMRIDTLILELL